MLDTYFKHTASIDLTTKTLVEILKHIQSLFIHTLTGEILILDDTGVGVLAIDFLKYLAFAVGWATN